MITKTFPLTLNTSTSASTVIEVAHFRDILIETGDSVAIYLEAMFCNISLKNFQLMRFASYDGDEDEAERLSKFTEAELKSQKVGLRILTRKNNTGNWRERAEVILTNAGRKSYFDLLIPYLAKAQVKLLEYNDSLGVQLIDYGNGLLKENDFIEIECACSVQIEKKNNIDALQARIETLELALAGKLTNIPANNLLGRNASTGNIELIPQSKFATPAQIEQAIVDWVGSAPENLNTLIEFGNAINNDASFAATTTNLLASKASLTELLKYFPKANYNLSGSPNDYLSGVQGADKDLGEGLTGWHFITSIRSDSPYGIQLAIGDIAQRIKYRIKTNNIWSVWKTLFVGNNAGLENKLFTGITASTQGGTTQIAHGLNSAKIENITGLIKYSAGNTVPINGMQPNYQTWTSSDTTYINVYNVASNSAGILSAPFTLTAWYTL